MKHFFAPLFSALALIISSCPAAAAGALSVDGGALELFWLVPFIGVLLSIAIIPLLAPYFWHSHMGRISAFWVFAFLVPFTLTYGYRIALFETVYILLLDYFPFIILLFALYTVAGGVRLTGSLRGTPALNTGILLFGTLIASWMGTTGAAMLLIRPLIQANEWRRNKVHVVVFFIFLVANIGGSLTPLGDPPLFLGFLKGVDFFWPTTHLLAPMMLTAGILLGLFYLIDRYYFAKEAANAPPKTGGERLGIEGGVNILLLAGILGAVLLSGLWRPDIHFTVYHVSVEAQNLVRDALLLLLAFLSLRITRLESRMANAFTWFPMIEVAKLFAGIFLTIIPAIAILKAGAEGELSQLIAALSVEGEPVNAAYFWFTGILSSLLDNAPTYLVFFNIAGGDPVELMGPLAETLLAISCGAVFMGAMTYIGNAPNFMVRSIAEERGVPMPSFFGYMGWSVLILVPVFILVTLVFFP